MKTNGIQVSHRKLIESYFTARESIIHHGFAAEIDWQESRKFETLRESEFLREAAWVVLSAGMREKIVRNCFSAISSAFLEWGEAEKIVRKQSKCKAKAAEVFNHPGKIHAIASICETVAAEGFEKIHEKIRLDGIDFLQTLSYIGPITRYHLAKNIGIDVVKPDRHLTRISKVARFPSPKEFCQVIVDATGERLSVVDLVIWRYATIDPNYLSLFRL